ncbi:MAG TPA: hypothetical protein VHB25_17705 [Gemmatimonadaceae bacterium]|nr:hypothetical protein [Gemmatimonadaceae bacterium]
MLIQANVIRRRSRAWAAALVLALAPLGAARAQSDSAVAASHARSFWTHLLAGAATSLLLHEAGHVGMSYAVGGHPSFGFDAGRPTVYSGINSSISPHRQFLFSGAGLAVQTLLDEGILDIPHTRGGAFERGLLAGGLGTTLFYLTIGRTGSVSDIQFMARVHGMTKTQSTFLFGGIVALQSFRISRDAHYAHFFVAPSATAHGVAAGVNVSGW